MLGKKSDRQQRETDLETYIVLT